MRKALVPIICATLLLFGETEQFCGQPVFKPILSKQDRAGNRISNGIEARKHSHPWQALILIMNPEGPTICGGSLMHWKHENASAFILTAAHCLINWIRYNKEKIAWEKTKGALPKRYEGYPLVNISNVVVRLGVHDLKQSTSATKELRATAMAVAELDISNKTDDIALLKLEKEVTYNAEIQGICLPAENEVLPPESLCLVAGWGRLRDEERGKKLQQFQTHIINGKVNNPYYHQEDRMICTGSQTRNTGARKGDSGGPLVCMRNNTFVVYGVLSFGFSGKCTGATDGQVFTKVAKYLPWLRKKIAELSIRA